MSELRKWVHSYSVTCPADGGPDVLTIVWREETDQFEEPDFEFMSLGGVRRKLKKKTRNRIVKTTRQVVVGATLDFICEIKRQFYEETHVP